ncbi:hypothetical protein [Streptomyces sp. BRA346]|uniref:hypothetical protein n=1 Tax=Streptomyces sp. BRA346 TaxID=2878199 RepID=UPI004062EC1C
MRNLIAVPLVWVLAQSTVVVLLVAMLVVGLPATDALQDAGMSFNTAVLASMPMMCAAGLGAALAWSGRRSSGRRPFADACSEAAHAVADWAGWPDPRTPEESSSTPQQ